MARYFHGTLNRLEINGTLLPPLTTRVPSCSTIDSQVLDHRLDRVYITTNWLEAQIYAVTKFVGGESRPRRYAGRGYVYEVKPQGDLWFDPMYVDWPDKEQYLSCKSALIIGEYRPAWDVVALRCIRHLIEEQNNIDLGYGLYLGWPKCKEYLINA